ncbi:MAG: hypothetical protein JSS63_00665 [Bacteroidetes bacterium]|nr:hypothetical protein [Bacteroidota bacterium]MBX7044446.1 hypothetical protein [Ignavibacteria bacterium]
MNSSAPDTKHFSKNFNSMLVYWAVLNEADFGYLLPEKNRQKNNSGAKKKKTKKKIKLKSEKKIKNEK